MEVGLPGRIGVNAVHNVVRDFKGGIDGVTALLRDGEDPYAKDLMSKEQNALHPLVLVSRVPWGPFFNYVDHILPIIDHLVDIGEEIHLLLYGKICIPLTFPVPST